MLGLAQHDKDGYSLKVTCNNAVMLSASETSHFEKREILRSPLGRDRPLRMTMVVVVC